MLKQQEFIVAQTKRDNTVMKVIVVLTALFLPGTFIAVSEISRPPLEGDFLTTSQDSLQYSRVQLGPRESHWATFQDILVLYSAYHNYSGCWFLGLVLKDVV